MSGSTVGGKKASEKILDRDPDFYKRIGSKGGKAPKKTPAGFAYMRMVDPEGHSVASALGGSISRRRKAQEE